MKRSEDFTLGEIQAIVAVEGHSVCLTLDVDAARAACRKLIVFLDMRAKEVSVYQVEKLRAEIKQARIAAPKVERAGRAQADQEEWEQACVLVSE